MAEPEEDPRDFTDQFNTPLSLDQQFEFDSKYGAGDSYDYDMQGFHAANPDVKMDEGQHFPDTFKKPNHPTFSTESKYHGTAVDAKAKYRDDGEIEGKTHEGGEWELLDNNKFAFTPGRTNLEHHSTQELIDYFKKHEPNSRLVLPGY